jgi:hypothetical protein
MKSILAGAALALTAALAAGPSLATTITDPAGDFLATYTGPKNPDLDIRSVTVSLDNSNDFVVSATMNGPLGQTADADYVFGVNTGSGVPLFGPSENHVLFDSAIVLNTGKGSTPPVVASDLLNPSGPVITVIGSGAGTGSVSVSGDTITGIIPISLLPGSLTPGRYGFNLWTRIGITANFPTDFADFAPDNATFTAVPEPSNWALMILGVGAMGAMLRSSRRRTRPAIG